MVALFRVEFSGRGELSERQQLLGKHLAQLVKLAEEFNIAVLVVNQCMADPGGMLSVKISKLTLCQPITVCLISC